MKYYFWRQNEAQDSDYKYFKKLNVIYKRILNNRVKNLNSKNYPLHKKCL